MLSTENRNLLKSISIYDKIPFEFNDGWTDLIYTLGKNIEMYCKLHDITTFEVRQIKEKFGSLRFYYTGSNDEIIRTMVREAEEQTEIICEKCGKRGSTLVDNGKWYTACKEHTVEGSLTTAEFKVIQDARSKAMRKCNICDKKGADGYWTGSIHTNRCEEHREDFITDDEYFIQWEEERKNATKNK